MKLEPRERICVQAPWRARHRHLLTSGRLPPLVPAVVWGGGRSPVFLYPNDRDAVKQ